MDSALCSRQAPRREPVYVLISKPRSQPERIRLHPENPQRATLVGEKTDGGAHPGASYRLIRTLSYSSRLDGRINPVSELNWEGLGVTPDVLVPQEQTSRWNLQYGPPVSEFRVLADRHLGHPRL